MRSRPYTLEDAWGIVRLPHYRVDMIGPLAPDGSGARLGVWGGYLVASADEAEERCYAAAEQYCEEQGVPYFRSEWNLQRRPMILQGN